MELKVNIIPGELPRFWEREAVFFANLHSLFFGNAQLTKILESQVHGVPTYGGRLVSILNLIFRKGKNLIFLEAPPDASLLDYLSNTLRLTLPDMEILPHSLYASFTGQTSQGHLTAFEPVIERLRSHSAEWVDGYVTDEALTSLAERSGKSTITTLAGSKKGNNKFLLHHHLLGKGLPVFDTLTASSPGEITSCLARLRDRGYGKAVLKSQIGASGCGMVKHDMTACPGKQFPEFLFFEGPCLVQGWLDDEMAGVRRVGSPSAQMFLSEKELSLFDITEQFLREDSIHEGNISPPPYLSEGLKEEILSQAEIAGRWLHSQGYRGTASVDFLVIEREGREQALICEINARVTGATYPAVLARYFQPHGAWLMRNIRFRPPRPAPQLLRHLEREDLLFRPDREEGVLPCNFNADENGDIHKGQFIFLARKQETCLGLLSRLQKALPESSAFDRD